MIDSYSGSFPTIFLPLELPTKPKAEENLNDDENLHVLKCIEDFLASKSSHFARNEVKDHFSAVKVEKAAKNFVSLNRNINESISFSLDLQAEEIIFPV